MDGFFVFFWGNGACLHCLVCLGPCPAIEFLFACICMHAEIHLVSERHLNLPGHVNGVGQQTEMCMSGHPGQFEGDYPAQVADNRVHTRVYAAIHYQWAVWYTILFVVWRKSLMQSGMYLCISSIELLVARPVDSICEEEKKSLSYKTIPASFGETVQQIWRCVQNKDNQIRTAIIKASLCRCGDCCRLRGGITQGPPPAGMLRQGCPVASYWRRAHPDGSVCLWSPGSCFSWCVFIELCFPTSSFLCITNAANGSCYD